MPSNSHASTKRARSDSQRTQDLSEERSQVISLVQKRRLQNRISQRNYRTYRLQSRNPISTKLHFRKQDP